MWRVETSSKFWSILNDKDTVFFTISAKVRDYYCYIEEHVYTSGETCYITRCNAEIDSDGYCMASATHETIDAAVAQMQEFITTDLARRETLTGEQVKWTPAEVNERGNALQSQMLDFVFNYDAS